MRFDFKINEVKYIQKQFPFESLLGVDKRPSSADGVLETLKNKGAVIEREGRPLELANEYRYLFSAWEKMRYTVVRPEVDDGGLLCVLANERDVIIFSRVGEEVSVELLDYNSELMDNILFNLGEFDSSVTSSESFNISVSVEDFEGIVTSTKEGLIAWSGKLGIDAETLAFYNEMIQKRDFFMYLCEDHLEEVGTLTKVVKSDKGYCALKHVTPKESENERMVMIFGDSQKVIDSIYVF